VINLNIGAVVTSKGETLLDTVDNLVAMNADMFVVRPRAVRRAHLIAAHLNRTAARTSTVGQRRRRRHAHPTQGLLDLSRSATTKRDFRNLAVASYGDSCTRGSRAR